jgi:myosin heavy subunit
MKLLGFGIDDRRRFFKLLAGVLHLGNVAIKGTSDGDGCKISVRILNTCRGSRIEQVVNKLEL